MAVYPWVAVDHIFGGKEPVRSRTRPGSPSTCESFVMRDLVPGGYLLTHFVFWTAVSMIALGTNAVAIMLSFGLGLLVMESLKKG